MKRRTRQSNAGPALPWWLFAMATPIAYITLDYIIPSLAIGNPALYGFAQAAPYLAPVIALVLGGVAVVAALRAPSIAAKRRGLFDRQRDIDSIRSLSWLQFEQLVGETYRRRGYRVSENALKGADNGIDLWLCKDGGDVLVQCKHWKQNVGVSVVREHLGVVSAYKARRGVIVSSGSFTAAAQDFAQQTGIELVSGEQLAQLVSGAQSPTQTADDEPLLIVPGPESGPQSCPDCGGDMVRRVARRGPHAGQSFLGCSRWPECSGTRPVGELC